MLYSVAPAPGAEAAPDTGAAQPVVDLHTLIDLGVDTGLMAMDADLSGEAPAVDASLDAEEDDSPKLIDVAPSAENSEIRHELVFVDSQIEQHSELMDALREQTDPNRVIDIVVLDANRDGIEQITEALSGRHDVDAVHVLSHGTDGALKLGGTWLHEGNLGGYAGEIAQWQHSLSSGADLLVYGCDLAASAKGQLLIEALQTLTGADVAASTDDTGAALLGGDWDLELRLGSVETPSLGDGGLASWNGVLAAFTVTNTNDFGAGSLRQAISDANALSGLDTITFNISGAGPHTINVLSALPTLTEAVVIDGTTQTGFSGTPIIELNGASAGSGADGLVISGSVSGATIRGLVINRFGDDGIEVNGNNNFIVGNFLGTDVTGTIDLGNGDDGIDLNGDNNLVGGLTTADRNLISGNGDAGVNINGSGNSVVGNFIGTNRTGTAALGNSGSGVFTDSANNSIGGTASGAGNVLSGNNDCGITITGAAATGNVVQGNLIGTNAAGTAIIANGVDGILIDNGAANNTIGGTTTAARNVISGNVDDGIELDNGATGNIVRGNYIGTDITGTVDLGNQSDGVLVNASTTNNQIGGTAAGAGNLIAFNDGIGVDVMSGAGTGNSILGNSIHSNGSLGIDLNNDGVTANDAGDGDTGPNNLQNYPTLTSARTDDFSTVSVSGTLNNTANSTFRVEFFANSVADTSGHGEGQRFLGFATVTTDGSGNATFSQTLAASVIAGEVITATVTNTASGNTSEFSASVGIHGIVVSPTSGLTTTEDGATASFSVMLSLAPTADVTINIASSDTTEGTVSVSSLTFTTGNWNVAQNVTVTGVSDFLTDGNVAFSIVTSAASSTDANYNNRNPANVSVINQDGVNDAPVNSMPGPQSTNEDTTLTFSTATSNVISISDVDAASSAALQVTLTATNGTLSLSGIGGLSFTTGDGTLDATMTFTGTMANLNAALNGLRFVPTANFNGAASLQITTNDQGNSGSGGARTDTDSVAITVVADNDPPVITSNGGGGTASVSIAENTAAVTTVTSNDIDGGTPNYSIFGGADAARFTINGSTGVLTFLAAPDFELPTDVGGNNIYDVTVQVSDGAGGTDTQAIAVTVTNSTDSTTLYLKGDTSPPFSDLSTAIPTATSLSNYDPARDSELGLLIQKGGSGENETDDVKHHTWVVSGPVNISSQAVQLIFWTDLKSGMNAAQTSDVALSKNATVTAYLLDLATVTTESGGTVIATGSVTDATWGDGFAWEQKTIDFGTVNYSVAPGRNLAVKLVVEGSSGDDLWFAYDTTTFTSRLAIGSGNTAPAITSHGGGATASISVAENTTAVTTVTATDADLPAQTMTFSITGGSDAASFSINAATGALAFLSAPNYEVPSDAGGNNIYDVTVQVSDGEGGTDTQAIAVTVTPVNDNTPIITSNGGGAAAAISVAENSTAVTTVVANDADLPPQALTYSIIGGADATRFTIDNATGALSFLAVPDYESPTDAGANNVYDVIVQVSDGSRTDSQSIAVAITNITEGFWLSTSNDVSNSGVPGPTSWSKGEVLQFGDPNLDLEPGTGVTSGTFSDVFNLQSFASGANVDAIEYVTRTLTIGGGGNTLTLQAGDVLLSLDGSATLISNNSLSVVKDEVFLFRPTTPGNYSSGTFTMVLDDFGSIHGGGDTWSLALVEQNTTVGDYTLSAGSFLFSRQGGAEHGDIRLFTPTGVGTGTTAGTVQTLVEGADAGIGISTKIFGLELVESPVTLGGVTLTAGTILMSVDNNDTIGSNNLAVTRHDVFALSFSQTTLGSGSAIATATLLLDGSDVGLDSTNEELDGLALYTSAFNQPPVITSDGGGSSAAVTVTENSTSVTTITSTDADGGIPAYTITGGADSALFTIDGSTGALSFVAPRNSEAPTDANLDSVYEVVVQVSDGNGGLDSQSISVSVSDLDEFDVTAISDTNGATNAVNENSAIGTTVGVTAFASDADATTNTISYSLDDNAGGRFAIDNSTGVVTVAGSLDRESTASHNIVVRATSADGSSSTQSFSIAVNDVDEFDTTAISDTNAAANNVNENAANGTTVGITAFASDADATTNAITYSLDNNAGGRFAINGSTGAITVADGTLLNREAAASHNIVARATSADGSFSTQAYTINVNDVDEFDVGPISDTNGAANAVNENAANGTTVGITAFASDADATTNAISYSLDDNAGGRFAIDDSNGVVTVADGTLLNREAAASHNIVVRATSADGSFSSQAYTINVNDVDEFDVGAISDTNVAANSVAENSTIGTAVGVTAFASDADATTNAISYSLDDNAGGRFAIDGSTGVVTVAGAIDREAAASHNITVRATSDDGSFSTQTYSIAVNDVDEFDVSPIADTNAAADTVVENSAVGTTVGITAFASDSDATTNAISYSLDDDAGGLFAIDPSSGVITVAGAIDFESASSHAITVRATSADGSFALRGFTIAVTDANEVGITTIGDTNGAADQVAENSAAGTSVGITAFADDADGTDTVSYSLDDDAGGRFAIDANSGVVTVAGLLNAESSTNHTITIRATSTDGSFSTRDFTIAVIDLDEFDTSAVSDTDGTVNSVDENAATGTTVGVTAFASDADATTNAITYSLDDDAGGLFAIDPNTGIVSVAGSIDRESAASHLITVRATSADGSFSTSDFTIAVNDVDEFDITPVSDVDPSANSVSENATTGTTVGVIAFASDADATTNGITFTLDDDAAGRFAIDANTGLVTVAGSLDYESTTSLDITIRATSADGSSSTQLFTIDLIDLNDVAPTITAGQTFVVDENSANGNSLGSITATDPDTVGSLQGWTIVGGNVGNAFAIDPTTGELTVADGSQLDFETQPTYTLTLQVGDGVNTSATQDITINLANVNEAPVNGTPAAQMTDEDTPLVFSATNGNAISVSDVDAGGGMLGVRLMATHGTLTLGTTTNLTLILGDGDADRDIVFAGTPADVNAALEGLTFTPDANFNGTASVEFATRDMGNSGSGGEGTDSDAISITVRSVNDAPVATSESYSVSPSDSLTVLIPGVLNNDSDVDGDSLQAVLVTGPSYGTVTLAPDGSFVYTPNGMPSTTDTFSYLASDGQADSNVVTVTINFNASGPILVDPTDPPDPPTPTTDPPPDLPPGGVTIIPPPSPPPALLKPVPDELTPWENPNVVALTHGTSEDLLPAPVDPLRWVNLLARNEESPEEIVTLDEPVTTVSAESTPLIPLLEFSVAGSLSEVTPSESDTPPATEFDEVAVGTTVISTFSLGYVLWTLRGGHLLTTFLATMPAWRLMDPLPVLQSFTSSRDKDEDREDDGGLAEIIRKRSKPISPKPPQVSLSEK